MCEMRMNACVMRGGLHMRGGGIRVLWEEEFMCERGRNPCAMGGGMPIWKEEESVCDWRRNSCLRGGGIHE